MRRFVKSNKYGYTLVELIVVVVIMVIVLAAVITGLVIAANNLPDLDMIG